jgi:SAM-dependent methyltransferase
MGKSMPDASPTEGLAASPWVARFAPLVAAGGVVLDVAAGGGRHSLLFAGRGHAVIAVDRDVSRLPAAPGIEAVEADLENSRWPFADRHFAGVVVTNYLHRPLLPLLVAAVAPGGVLLYETFARGNERYGRPGNPDFLLEPGELLAAVASKLTVIAYEHLKTDRPAVVQRICAVSGDPPV